MTTITLRVITKIIIRQTTRDYNNSNHLRDRQNKHMSIRLSSARHGRNVPRTL